MFPARNPGKPRLPFACLANFVVELRVVLILGLGLGGIVDLPLIAPLFGGGSSTSEGILVEAAGRMAAGAMGMFSAPRRECWERCKGSKSDEHRNSTVVLYAWRANWLQ